MRLIELILFTTALLVGVAPAGAADKTFRFHTGTQFRDALRKPLSASWDNMDLRTIVRRIEADKRVAMLIDRRIDPSRIRFADAADEPLSTFVERMAAESNAGAAFVGNVVYMGPVSSASKLRTLAAIRTQELSEKQSGIPKGRTSELTRARTFQWADLDRPAEILERIAEEAGLSISGIEQVPHDLWAAATLPDASTIDSLSLVLAQFDLTFAWVDEARGIRLEPIPEIVAIERPHPPPRGVSPAAAIERWKEEVPGLAARVEKGQIVVTGTVEIHELIDRIRRGERAAHQISPEGGPRLERLANKRYSLKIQQSPASALLKKLEEPAHGKLTFKYDAAELKSAGIDLDKRVTFDVTKVPIEELLKHTFDPLGVEFEIDLETRIVTLKPARRSQ